MLKSKNWFAHQFCYVLTVTHFWRMAYFKIKWVERMQRKMRENTTNRYWFCCDINLTALQLHVSSCERAEFLWLSESLYLYIHTYIYKINYIIHKASHFISGSEKYLWFENPLQWCGHTLESIPSHEYSNFLYMIAKEQICISTKLWKITSKSSGVSKNGIPVYWKHVCHITQLSLQYNLREVPASVRISFRLFLRSL